MGKTLTDSSPRSIGEHPSPESALRSWSQRYGEKHTLRRVIDYPFGIIAPKRVRVYRRCNHYVLQWWDPAAKQNLSDRVDGDLVTAITRARQIEERMECRRSSNLGRRRLEHRELVEAFVTDLGKRADAGQLGPGTVRRYDSALAHYLAFTAQAATERAYPSATGVNREFQLAFAAFLSRRQVAPNGRPGAAIRPLKGRQFVEDVARAMFAWAADPERGALLSDEFRNPFLGKSRQLREPAVDPLAEPEITTAMAAEFLGACDVYQLRLFAPLIFFGLRASEPCYLFREHLQQGWLRVPCLPELAYQTKGRREKRFPLVDFLDRLLTQGAGGSREGLLFVRRRVAEGQEQAPLFGAPLAKLVDVFRRRCAACRNLDAAQKTLLRDEVLRAAGGLGYDHIEGEFRALASRLGWSAAATLKDFRHHFCTGLENAGMPEHYRRYMMGHAPGRASIVTYTHLNRLPEHFEAAMTGEWGELIDTTERRAEELARR